MLEACGRIMLIDCGMEQGLSLIHIFHRIQFTPDVLPSDLTGFSIYRREEERLSLIHI